MRWGAWPVLILALAGCEARHIVPEIDPALNPPAKVVQSVSFNQVYLNVFEPKCVGCHSRVGGVDLENRDVARSFLKNIERVAVRGASMPMKPFTALSVEQRTLLSAWIRAGGPDLPKDGGASPEIPPLSATFESIRDRIFVPRCLVCHHPGGEAPRVPLATREDLLNSPLDLVVPGSPEESGLYIVVQPGARKLMPPKKSHITPLNEREIASIREWIAAGAVQ